MPRPQERPQSAPQGTQLRRTQVAAIPKPDHAGRRFAERYAVELAAVAPGLRPQLPA